MKLKALELDYQNLLHKTHLINILTIILNSITLYKHLFSINAPTYSNVLNKEHIMMRILKVASLAQLKGALHANKTLLNVIIVNNIILKFLVLITIRLHVKNALKVVDTVIKVKDKFYAKEVVQKDITKLKFSNRHNVSFALILQDVSLAQDKLLMMVNANNANLIIYQIKHKTVYSVFLVIKAVTDVIKQLRIASTAQKDTIKYKILAKLVTELPQYQKSVKNKTMEMITKQKILQKLDLLMKAQIVLSQIMQKCGKVSSCLLEMELTNFIQVQEDQYLYI